MKFRTLLGLAAAAVMLVSGTSAALAEKLVISNWDGYMPKDMAERVDLITVFKWNIARSEYADVFTALSRRISSQGKVVIGIYDELYISDPYGVAVRPHAEQYFGKVEAKRFPGTWNRYVLVCTNPNLA